MISQTRNMSVQAAYDLARERYAALGVNTDAALGVNTDAALGVNTDAALGVNTDAALDRLRQISISLHCWQGDDVRGFERTGGEDPGELGGGLATTGNYAGRARNADELRRDLDQAYSLIPGTHRLSLHAIYAETGNQPVPRNELRPEHFSRWVDWARANHHGLDFNPTCFSHPLAESGLTLASYDAGIRRFWIEHCIACRQIGAFFGRELGQPCVTNIWVPDGMKDTPIDRQAPRLLLRQSLDEILAAPVNPDHNLDAVEGKLFGLGSESYVVGSHEFYLGYALTRHVLLTLDSGHYHPTEVISDKLSAVLAYLPQALLHVSRGVRWDSDHVVTLNDELQAIMQELVRGGFLERVYIGLDYFDASINRVAAWVIGTRNALRGLLMALLEPIEQMRALEVSGDYTGRLALLEELKGMPFGAVWDYYCLTAGVPVGLDYLDEIRAYERQELSRRS